MQTAVTAGLKSVTQLRDVGFELPLLAIVLAQPVPGATTLVSDVDVNLNESAAQLNRKI